MESATGQRDLMGTDIHGPWIEAFWDDGKNEHAVNIAELLLFDRDYIAFMCISSARYQNDDYRVIPESRGIPREVGWAWQQHLARSAKHEIEDEYRRYADWKANYPGLIPEGYVAEPFHYPTLWKNELWRTKGGCFGHSWLLLAEVEQAAANYLRYMERWEIEEPSTFAKRDIIPHPGLSLAVVTMRWAEEQRPYAKARMCFCFDC